MMDPRSKLPTLGAYVVLSDGSLMGNSEPLVPADRLRGNAVRSTCDVPSFHVEEVVEMLDRRYR